MFLTQVLKFLLGTAAATHPQTQNPIDVDDLLSYECARSVAGMLEPDDQSGPLFVREDLVFTSVQAKDGSKLLIVNAGSGTYALPLGNSGVNRIKFSIPARDADAQKKYYLTYLHDEAKRSRVFEFATLGPPGNKVEADFKTAKANRADELLPNLEFKIHETAETVLALLAEDRLDRRNLKSHKAEHCEHIARRSPALGKILKRNLDVVAAMVVGAGSRAPASAKSF